MVRNQWRRRAKLRTAPWRDINHVYVKWQEHLILSTGILCKELDSVRTSTPLQQAVKGGNICTAVGTFSLINCNCSSSTPRWIYLIEKYAITSVLKLLNEFIWAKEAPKPVLYPRGYSDSTWCPLHQTEVCSILMNLAQKLIRWLVKYCPSLNICFFLAAPFFLWRFNYWLFQLPLLTLEGHFSIPHSNPHLPYRLLSAFVFILLCFSITASSSEKKSCGQEYVSAEPSTPFHAEQIASSYFIYLVSTSLANTS